MPRYPIRGRRPGRTGLYRQLQLVGGGIVEYNPVTEETITNIGVATQSLSVEATSESDSNSASSSQTSSQSEAQAIANGGTASQAFGEGTKDTLSTDATSSQSLTNERTAESPQNSAASTQSLSTERTTETDTNSANSSQTILSADVDSGGSSGSGSQSFTEATKDTLSNQGGPPTAYGGYSAGFDFGTNGATISTGDAGDANAWDTVNLNSAPLTYDGTYTAAGSARSAKFEGTGGSGGPEVIWNTFGTKTDYYFRIYFRIAATGHIVNLIDTYLGGSHAWSIRVRASDGKIIVGDRVFSGETIPSTNVVNVGAWNRLEGRVNHSTSFFEYKLYLDPDSATPTETQSITSGVGYLSGIDEARMGLGALAPAVVWYDEIVIGATQYVGASVEPQRITEKTSETVTNSATSAQTLTSAEVDSGTSTGTGTQSSGEKVAETAINIGGTPVVPTYVGGLTADFEGGVDGATITTGAGEASAKAWDVVSGTPVYSNAQSAHGSLSASLSGATDEFGWISIATSAYGRAYFYASENPSGETLIIKGSAGGDWSFRITASGTVTMHDSDALGGHNMTTTAVIDLNSWVRFEWFVVVSATVGQLIFKLFNDPDSTTPTETLTSPATWNTGTGVNNQIRFSIQGDWFTNPVYFDDIVANATSYPGPATYTSWFGTRNTSGSNEEFPANNYVVVSPFTLTEAAFVNELRIFCRNSSGGPLMRGMIYTDSADNPDVLMGVTDEVSISNLALAWNQLPFSSPVFLPAGDYWLGFNHSSGTQIGHRFQDAVAAQGRWFRSDTYDASPVNPFGTASGGDSKITTMYATSEALADNQTILEYSYDTLQNIGGPLEYGEGNYGQGDYGIGEPHSILEEITSGPTGETDTLTNTGTASQTILSAEAGSESGSGSGSQTLSEATVETVSNSATATHTLTTDRTSDTEGNTGTGTQAITERTAETVSNSASSSQTLSTERTSDTDGNTGTGSQTLSEKTAETVSNTGVGSQTMAEAIRESVTNSATNTPFIVDLSAETEGNTGTGTQAISEATAEGASNTGTNTPDVDEDAPEAPMTSVGFSSQSLAESIAELFSHTQTSTQTFGEADADSPGNSATNTQSISDLETDTATNTGTGSHNTNEATAETDSVEQLAFHSIDDAVTTRVVPFSDITTGTWTVVPLYEKVDELYAVGGYPTESIRSAVNPINDTAVMGLTPVSDPSNDDNHYINVEFWRDGSDELDFIIRLKEGATVIAERTFENVLETEDAPRQERIALTQLEASAIVDYSNLNIELVANQV